MLIRYLFSNIFFVFLDLCVSKTFYLVIYRFYPNFCVIPFNFLTLFCLLIICKLLLSGAYYYCPLHSWLSFCVNWTTLEALFYLTTYLDCLHILFHQLSWLPIYPVSHRDTQRHDTLARPHTALVLLFVYQKAVNFLVYSLSSFFFIFFFSVLLPSRQSFRFRLINSSNKKDIYFRIYVDM